MMTEVDICNWEGEGGPEFQSRLRDHVHVVRRRPVAAAEDEAPELDIEHDCD